MIFWYGFCCGIAVTWILSFCAAIVIIAVEQAHEAAEHITRSPPPERRNNVVHARFGTDR